MEKTMELQLSPDMIPVISRQNAQTFHNQVKERIKETGEGLFEYLETLKFFEKLKEVISGKEGQEGDKEIKEMVRTEIAKYGKEFKTLREAKFELAETGTKYNFSKCNDIKLSELEEQLEIAKANLKERQEFLKNIPSSGFDYVDMETGAITKLYPPSKSSTSSYKITLPK